MNLAELNLILLILNIFLTLWSIRVISLTVTQGLAALNAQLANAIQGIIEGGLGSGFEAPNPIQQAIAEMLKSRLQGGPIEMGRDAEGKFSSEKVS